MADRSKDKATIVWFRADLRLGDNHALRAAVERGAPIIAVFVLDEESKDLRPIGGAQRWWLHHSLTELGEAIAERGGKLILRTGKAGDILADLVRQAGAGALYFNRRYDAAGMAVDSAIRDELSDEGLDVQDFPGRLLHDPDRVKTNSGGPYRVYTPFWRAIEKEDEPREPLAKPQSLTAPARQPVSDKLDDWKLLPRRPDWSGGIAEAWEPGEKAALRRLKAFVADDLGGYGRSRERPADEDGTSGLSPHLAFGEISPYQIWHATRSRPRSVGTSDLTVFRKEVVWREFCYHLLYHRPDLPTANYDGRFDDFPWLNDKKSLEAWQSGQTGYPMVDAGMRQLWKTGWMHNRVRMIVASFLTKHLLIHWREGECWFWDTLVDADPASNAANWQWVAGCGADAAPYFRIFNPILQGEKFDPEGDYVRAHVPELAELPARYIHKPFEAPAEVLEKAGVKLGKTYPNPIVVHKDARKRALTAYDAVKDAA